MTKKIILKLILITAFVQTVSSQQKESGIFVDSLGQIYVQASKPAYFFIAPENNQGSRILIPSNDPKSNPMYFDGNGTHYLKTQDAETNKSVNYRIFADGIAPKASLLFKTGLIMHSGKRFYINKGSVAEVIGSDALSGVRAVSVSLDGSPFTNVNTIAFDKKSDYWVKAFAIDNVGNVSDTIQYRVITAVNSIVKINNVYFDTNSSRIRSESKVELDDFAQTLKEYPELRIELLAHTDCRGEAEYNLNLSEKRAESILYYLLNKGISRDRLSFKGCGDTQPVNECTKGVQCSDEKHQENRRVEFKILLNK